MTDVMLILWNAENFNDWRTVVTLVFRSLTYFYTLRKWVLWWFPYCWYFDILSSSMIDVLLVLWYTQYFDVSRYFILWDNEYFDGCHTVDTLIYLVFRLLAYFWYFNILCISIIYVCWYFDILSISVYDAVLIFLFTQYFDDVLLILWYTYVFDY